MAQEINDNFRIVAALPLDDRYRKLTITERDNIESTRRYLGMQCFVVQTSTCYALISGTANSDWQPIWGLQGGAGGGAFYVVDTYAFMWQKGRNRVTGVINENNEMEANDIILNGFALYEGEYKLIKTAEYVSGDPTLIASYNVIEYI